MSGFASDYKPSYINTSPNTHITVLDGYYQGSIAFGDHFTVEFGGRSYHHGYMRKRNSGELYFHSDINNRFTPDIVNHNFHMMIQRMGPPILSTSVAGNKSGKHSKNSLKYKNKSGKHSKKSLKYKNKSGKHSKMSLKYKNKSGKLTKKYVNRLKI